MKMEKSCGNVFADLGLPDSDELLAKAKLAHRIGEFIRERGLTQAQAAKLLRLDQPKVSALLNGKLTAFSTDRLLRLVTLLGRDVKIVIGPKPRSRPARISVGDAGPQRG
jgi:predicted XRE-type DNA-binding protein